MRGRPVARRTSSGSEGPAKDHAHRRWEYLEVDVRVETWSDSVGRSGRLPIAEAGPGQIPSVLALLNDLGAQGWELAAVSNTQSPLIYRLLLKRRAAGRG
ncbi:MAG TPA: hypothetical protein VFX49_13985 [Chloroflexota bacterium]|nr:hypothetical protein [Chloroflexota bacterium]